MSRHRFISGYLAAAEFADWPEDTPMGAWFAVEALDAMRDDAGACICVRDRTVDAVAMTGDE